LGIIVGAEALCALFGWGLPDWQQDPFVGFSNVRPLFVRNVDGTQMITAPSRRRFFPAQSFPRRKSPKTFRVFCFGGSTVQGNPYAEDTAFPTWLRLSLETADPAREWEIINCGGISYASYRLASIVQECLAYEPDLFILCTGHNEFLEDRTYTHIKTAPTWVRAPLELACRLRVFNLLRQAWLALNPPALSHSASAATPAQLREEVDAWLDYAGGIKAYHRDEAWRASVIDHFAFNLRRIIGLARNASVPIVLVQPPSNLRDCPPFKSQHRSGFSEQDLPAWEILIAEAHAQTDPKASNAVEKYRHALSIDNEYALTHFQIGRVYDNLGLLTEAKNAYLRARELDICPLRILAPMEQTMARAARESGTPFVNAQFLMEQKSEDGIPGKDWLLDHIHPSIPGHQVIAQALFEVMEEQGWIRPQPSWEEGRDAAHTNHLDSLPDSYFADGQKALEGLRAWTEGRASGPPIEYRMLGGNR
jgi:lysophospholipase L1-like esterase